MENPDVKALRDEITMMISENHKKDIAINKQRAQIQDLTKQIPDLTKQIPDLTKQIQDLTKCNRLSHIKELLKNVSS